MNRLRRCLSEEKQGSRMGMAGFLHDGIGKVAVSDVVGLSGQVA